MKNILILIKTMSNGDRIAVSISKAFASEITNLDENPMTDDKIINSKMKITEKIKRDKKDRELALKYLLNKWMLKQTARITRVNTPRWRPEKKSKKILATAT